MRPQPETIRLGDREWRLRPLTLAQVQAIEPILMESAERKNNVASAIAIVSVALARDHAVAVETLPDIEATASEISAAMAAVLRLGGFIEAKAGADTPGEAQADAISMSPSA